MPQKRCRKMWHKTKTETKLEVQNS